MHKKRPTVNRWFIKKLEKGELIHEKATFPQKICIVYLYKMMEKRTLLTYLLGLLLPFTIQGQKNTQADNHLSQNAHEIVYRNALNYGDLQTAVHALHYMIAKSPEVKERKDTLCMLYYNLKMYSQARNLAMEILALDPSKTGILEINGLACEFMGLKVEAIGHYERLFQLTDKPYFLYQVASHQYQLQRFGECEANLLKIISHAGSPQEIVLIAVSENEKQKVPLVAAAQNILGVIKLEKNDKPAAIKAFESALIIFPDFGLAKSNLEIAKK